VRDVACVKLAWALGQIMDLGKVKDLMLTPIAGVTTEREPTTATSSSRAASPRSRNSSGSFTNKECHFSRRKKKIAENKNSLVKFI
jgi:hypothetical protein